MPGVRHVADLPDAVALQHRMDAVRPAGLRLRMSVLFNLPVTHSLSPWNRGLPFAYLLRRQAGRLDGLGDALVLTLELLGIFLRPAARGLDSRRRELLDDLRL